VPATPHPERDESPVRAVGDIFSPVSSGRISAEIVDQIKGAIREGQLSPGDRLPPERTLAEQFGASRVTVRDALRILEASGLIEIRVGARGGAFVTAPASEIVGEGLANMIMLASLSAEEVTEARFMLELGMMPMVCERATQDDIEALAEICKRGEEALRNKSYGVELSAEFHTRLARCAHNSAVEMIVNSFHGPLLMSLLRAKAVAPEMGGRGVEEHKELVDAIRERDPKRAYSIMAKHLARTAERLGLSKLTERLTRTGNSQ
jgi:GntR family transcriptional regulator, transcriptional repressor for pyruvate dehydrogenase complex